MTDQQPISIESKNANVDTPLRLGILGPVVIWCPEEERTVFPTGREARLLAALALRPGRLVSSSCLMDVVWDANLPKSPKSALHNVLYRIRQLLTECGMSNAVIGHSAGYTLNVDPLQIDAHRFELMLRSVPSNDRSAGAIIREALDLWRGDALQGLAGENQLFASEAMRLESLRSIALEDRIEAELRAGMERTLIPELRALTSQSPLNENLHGYLMVALTRAGRQSEALRVYRRLRAALVTELGMEPSESLQRLELAILNQEVETLESFVR